MPEVQRSPEARADLLQIRLYVAERNPQAADRLLDLIDQKCRLLAEMPGMGRDRPELRPALRTSRWGRS
jgi:toxin ParE1/3/4